MSIASRKERELKEREELILAASLELFLELGYIGFTIDKLAKKIDYAKGTIYKHFACKEDIIIKILNKGFVQRQELIARGAVLDLPERAKFFAASLGARLYNRLNPNLHKLMMIAKVESIWSKVSDEIKEEHNRLMHESYVLFDRAIQTSVETGVLELGEHESVDIFFTLVSLIVSFEGIINEVANPYNDFSFTDCFGCTPPVNDPVKMLTLAVNTYMDGLKWLPLTSEYDYDALEKEVFKTIYNDIVEAIECGKDFSDVF